MNRRRLFPAAALLLTLFSLGPLHIAHAKTAASNAHDGSCPDPGDSFAAIGRAGAEAAALAVVGTDSINLSAKEVAKLSLTKACERLKENERFEPLLMTSKAFNDEMAAFTAKVASCQNDAALAGVNAALDDLKGILGMGAGLGLIATEVVPEEVWSVISPFGGYIVQSKKDLLQSLQKRIETLRLELAELKKSAKTDQKKKEELEKLETIFNNLTPLKSTVTMLASKYYGGDAEKTFKAIASGDIITKVAGEKAKLLADRYYGGDLALAAKGILSGDITAKVAASMPGILKRLGDRLEEKWDEYKCMKPSLQADLLCNAMGVAGYQIISLLAGTEALKLTELAKATGTDKVLKALKESEFAQKVFGAVTGTKRTFTYLEEGAEAALKLEKNIEWLDVYAGKSKSGILAFVGAEDQVFIRKGGKIYRLDDPVLESTIAKNWQARQAANPKPTIKSKPDAPRAPPPKDAPQPAVYVGGSQDVPQPGGHVNTPNAAPKTVGATAKDFGPEEYKGFHKAAQAESTGSGQVTLVTKKGETIQGQVIGQGKAGGEVYIEIRVVKDGVTKIEKVPYSQLDRTKTLAARKAETEKVAAAKAAKKADNPQPVFQTAEQAGYPYTPDNQPLPIQRTPLAKGSQVIDSNVAIALDKRAQLAKLKPGEAIPPKMKLSKAEDAYLQWYDKKIADGAEMHIADKTALGEIRSGDIGAYKGIELDVKRASDEYKSIVKKLESDGVNSVGTPGGHADREIIADMFFAKTKPGAGNIPTYATADAGIYNAMARRATPKIDPAHLKGKKLYDAHPDGFDVTLVDSAGNSHTVKIVPIRDVPIKSGG